MKLAVIGAGNMGGAIVKGYLAAGNTPEDVIVCGHHPRKMAVMKEELGISLAQTPAEAAARADAVLLAVKPKDAAAVLEEIGAADRLTGYAGGDAADRNAAGRPLIISIAAGKTLADLDAMLGGTEKKSSGFRIIRAMPNTPAAVGAGMTAICRGPEATDQDAGTALEVFSSVGRAVEVPESLMDAVTGLSGSGPAFVYMFIEALADGGVAAGLPRQQAVELAAQTVLGSARMVLETGKGPGDLKDAVCSPGGTTITGVRELEASAFRSAAIEAVIAAAEKSASM